METRNLVIGAAILLAVVIVVVLAVVLRDQLFAFTGIAL